LYPSMLLSRAITDPAPTRSPPPTTLAAIRNVRRAIFPPRDGF
jgi:hypothetical protein